MAFLLGDWRVEPSLNLLSRGEKSVRVEPKVMELLVFLAAEAGDVVSKEAIMGALWPGVHVTQSSVFRHVSMLRLALEDDPKRPRYLETVPKRGYRLLVAPTDATSESAPARGRLRPVLGTLALVAVAVAIVAVVTFGRAPESRPGTRIAVAPFEDDGAPDVARALGAMLRHELELIDGVEVLRQSVRPGAERVDAVLAGDVRIGPDGRLVLEIELVESETGDRLWSGVVHGTYEDVASRQRATALEIASTVGATPSANDRRRATRHRPDGAAYRAYLEGELYENRVDCGSYARSISAYDEAMARDARFVDVYPRLFDGHIASAVLGCGPSEPAFDALRELLSRAEGEGLNASQLLQGRAALELWRDGDVRRALERFREAGDLPAAHAEADVSYAVALTIAGRARDGLREAERCLEALPVDLGENWALGTLLYLAGDYEEAAEQLRATLELYPGHRPTLQILALSYLFAGDSRSAVETAERAESVQGERWNRFDAVPGFVYASTGDSARGRDRLARWESRAEEAWVPKTALALLNLGLGEIGVAQTLLEQARTERDPWVLLVPVDPAFAGLSPP